MENASKALLIAGAILLCILIIAIGMYIYNSAQSTIQESLTSMSTQEIEAFNAQFETYKGAISGSSLSSFAGKLIANANTYEEEIGKIPVVCMPKITSSGTENIQEKVTETAKTQDYIDAMALIKNKVEKKHTYYVEFLFSKSGYIEQVNIYYGVPGSKTEAGYTNIDRYIPEGG